MHALQFEWRTRHSMLTYRVSSFLDPSWLSEPSRTTATLTTHVRPAIRLLSGPPSLSNIQCKFFIAGLWLLWQEMSVVSRNRFDPPPAVAATKTPGRQYGVFRPFGRCAGQPPSLGRIVGVCPAPHRTRSLWPPRRCRRPCNASPSHYIIRACLRLRPAVATVAAGPVAAAEACPVTCLRPLLLLCCCSASASIRSTSFPPDWIRTCRWANAPTLSAALPSTPSRPATHYDCLVTTFSSFGVLAALPLLVPSIWFLNTFALPRVPRSPSPSSAKILLLPVHSHRQWNSSRLLKIRHRLLQPNGRALSRANVEVFYMRFPLRHDHRTAAAHPDASADSAGTVQRPVTQTSTSAEESATPSSPPNVGFQDFSGCPVVTFSLPD